MFEVTEEEHQKISTWQANLHKKLIKEGKVTVVDGYPYSGAIGGTLTYSFTPTSIGVVFKVKDNLSGEVLDLTDYDSW